MEKEEIVNKIRKIKEEIKKLQEEINVLYEQLSSEGDIDYIFELLKRATHEEFYAIFFVDTNNVVKYISRKQESGSGAIIILSRDKKGYLMDDYYFDQKGNMLEIAFYEKYDIPDEIINKLKDVQESNIDYEVAPFFQLYYLLKKYPVSFVKVIDD